MAIHCEHSFWNGNIYLPSSNINAFENIYLELLTKYSRIIIVGDFIATSSM